MALLYNMPHSDNLRCSNPTCDEKAECILHMKDKTEKLFCTVHWLNSEYANQPEGLSTVNRFEKLRTPGERNK